MDGEILRSMKRSGLRKEVLLYLADIYPDRAPLTRISYVLDKHLASVSGALNGIGGNYTLESSLLSLNLVSVISRSGKKYYQLNRPFADEVLELINEKRRVEVEI